MVASLSWITGWINTSGWIALVATGGLLGSQIIIGIISLENASYSAQRWHQFLIYIGYTLFAFMVNAFGNRLLPYFNRAAFIWSVCGFVVISITVLGTSSPNYASADFVFRNFINETGWPDGIAWLLGLLQGALGLTGFDAVAHMIEEIPEAAIEGPKIMIYCVGMGLFTGFIFLMILLFVSGGDAAIDDIINSAAGANIARIRVPEVVSHIEFAGPVEARSSPQNQQRAMRRRCLKGDQQEPGFSAKQRFNAATRAKVGSGRTTLAQ
ncbi:MAG: hypothetical protein Q9159_006581 [Coniocarpon cinnabarinum]